MIFAASPATKIATSGQGNVGDAFHQALDVGGAGHWGFQPVATPKNHSVMKAFALLKAFRDSLLDTASALRQKLYPVIAPIPNRRPIAAE